MAVTREELNIKVSVEFKDGKKVVKEITGQFKELDEQLKKTGTSTEKLAQKQIAAATSVLKQNRKLQLQIDNLGKSEVDRIRNTLKHTKKEIDLKLAKVAATSKVALALRQQLKLEEKLAGAKISEEIRKTNEQLQKQADNLGKVARKSKDAAEGFSKTSKNIITMNQALELGEKALRAFSRAVGFTVNNFADFEKGVIGVVKTTNLTAQETEFFSQRMLDLSERVPIATKELLSIAQAAGQLGVRGVGNLENFADTIARVGSATNVHGEEAATALARILNVTSENIDKVDELASSVVSLGNNFAATESEILRTTVVIAQGIGQFGANAAQVAALGAASRDMGIRFELAGSAITRAFIEINSIVSKGGQKLKDLAAVTGQTADELKKSMAEDAVGTFRKFLQGLSMVDSQLKSPLLEQFGLVGVEINRVLPVLAKNIGTVDKAFRLSNKEFENATALQIESDKAFKALAARMQVLRNSIQNIGTRLGRVLEPALKKATEALISFMTSIGEVLSRINRMDFTPFVIAIGAIAGALLTVTGLLAGGAIISALVTLATFLAPIAASFIIIGANVALVTVGLLAMAAAVEFLVLNFKSMANIAGLAIKATVETISAVGDSISTLFSSMFSDSIKSATSFLNSVLTKTIEFLTPFTNLMNEIGKTIADVFNSAKKFVIDFFNDIVEFGKKAVQKIAEFFAPITKFIGDVFGDAADGASKAFDVAAGFIEDNFTEVAVAAEGGFGRVSDAVDKTNLNFGTTGDIITELSKTFGSLKLSMEGAGKAGEKAGSDTRTSFKELNDLLARLKKGAGSLESDLEKIKKQNNKIRQEIAKTGKTQAEGLRLAFDLEKKVLRLKIAELDVGTELRTQLEEQLELKEKLANLKIAEANPTDLQKVLDKLSIESVFGKGLKGFTDGMEHVVGFLNTVTLEVFEQGVAGMVSAFSLIGDGAEKLANVFDRSFEPIGDFINDIGDSISGAFEKSVDFLDKHLGPVFEQIADFFSFDDRPEGISNVAAAVQSPELQSATGAAGAAIGGLAAADAMADAVQALIDFGPNFLDKLSKIFTSLVDLPGKLLESIDKLGEALIKFITDFIPKFLEFIPKFFDSLGQILKKLPQAFFQLLQSLPQIISDVLSDLDEIIPEFISALISAAPKIALALVNFLVNGAPKIAFQLIKVMAIHLPIAIVNGILEGLKEIGKAITGLLTGNFDLGSIVDGVEGKIEDFARSVTGVGSQIFEVAGLKAEASAAERSKRLSKDIDKAANKAEEKIKKAMDIAKFLGKLALAWIGFKTAAAIAGAIWEQAVVAAGWLWEAAVKLAGVAWELIQPVAGAIWEAVVAAGATAWKAVQTVAGVVWEGFVAVASAVWEAAVALAGTVWEAIQVAAGAVWNAVVVAAGAIWEAIQTTAGVVWNAVVVAAGVVWEAIQTTAGVIWNAVVVAGGVIWEAIQTTAGIIWTGIVVAGSAVWETAQTVAGVAWNAVVVAAGVVWETAQTVAGVAWNAVVVAAGVVWETIQAVAGAAWELALIAAGIIWNAILIGGATAWAVVVEAAAIVAGLAMAGPIGLVIAGVILAIAAIAAVFENEKFKKGLSKIGDKFGEMGGKIAEGFKDAIDGLGDFFSGMFSGAGDALRKIFDSLNPANMMEKLFKDPNPGPGTPVEKMLGVDIPFVNFAQGGLVPRGDKLPGRANVAGDSEQNDTILSLLSPGEVVLSRTQVKKLEKIMGGIPKFAFGFKKPSFVSKIQSQATSLDKATGGHVAGTVKTVESVSAAISKGDLSAAAKAVDPTNNDAIKAGLEALKSLDPSALLAKFADRIMSELIKGTKNVLGFETGGFVPPAGGVVHDGEFVINKPAVNQVGRGFLEQVNQGRAPQGNTVVNVNIKIDSRHQVGEDFIRNRMMPVVKQEMKRASLDGEFLLSQRGVQ